MFITSNLLAEVARVLSVSAGVKHAYMVGGVGFGFESWEEATDARSTQLVVAVATASPCSIHWVPRGNPRASSWTKSDRDVNAPTFAAALGSLFGFGRGVGVFIARAHHAAPLHYNMMTTFHGGTTVVMEKFDPEMALKLIRRITSSLTASGCPSCSIACSNCRRTCRCLRHELDAGGHPRSRALSH